MRGLCRCLTARRSRFHRQAEAPGGPAVSVRNNRRSAVRTCFSLFGNRATRAARPNGKRESFPPANRAPDRTFGPALINSSPGAGTSSGGGADLRRTGASPR